MTIYYLYVKVHKITGLRYLGQTKQNPHTYKGSGVDWERHIKQYGNNVDTSILLSTTNINERNYWGRYYSMIWNVVSAQDDYGNKIWANRIPETGGGNGNKLTTLERRALGKRNVAKQILENNHNWSKRGSDNINYDHTLYKFENMSTGEIIESTQADFRAKFRYLQGNVSALIRGAKHSCGNWKLFGNKTPNRYIVHNFINIVTGNIVHMNQDDFVKTYNLNRGHVCQMIKQNKKCQSVKGWKLYSSYEVVEVACLDQDGARPFISKISSRIF